MSSTNVESNKVQDEHEAVYDGLSAEDDYSNDKHVIDDEPRHEHSTENVNTQNVHTEDAKRAPSDVDDVKKDNETNKQIDALSVMFPSISKDIITSVLSESQSQEAAIESLLQMSDSNYKPPKAPTPRFFDADEALAKRLQEMDFQRNGRASSTPYDDIPYEPRRRTPKLSRDEREQIPDPGFNFQDIGNAFMELAATSKKHLSEFFASFSEPVSEQPQQKPSTSNNNGSDAFGDTRFDEPHTQQQFQQPQQQFPNHQIQINNNQNSNSGNNDGAPRQDYSHLGFLPRREIDLSQNRTNRESENDDNDDDYTHNPFNERK